MDRDWDNGYSEKAMEMVTKAMLVVAVILLLVYAVRRGPLAADYYTCYREAYKVYDENGIILRRFNQGEEAVCLERKAIIIAGRVCLDEAKEDIILGEAENNLLDRLSRQPLWGVKDINQMIEEHNLQCPSIQTTIRYDPRTGEWY